MGSTFFKFVFLNVWNIRVDFPEHDSFNLCRTVTAPPTAKVINAYNPPLSKRDKRYSLQGKYIDSKFGFSVYLHNIYTYILNVKLSNVIHFP